MAQHELVYIENSEFQTFQHRSSQKLSYELIEMGKVQVIKLTYHTPKSGTTFVRFRPDYVAEL